MTKNEKNLIFKLLKLGNRVFIKKYSFPTLDVLIWSSVFLPDI